MIWCGASFNVHNLPSVLVYLLWRGAQVFCLFKKWFVHFTDIFSLVFGKWDLNVFSLSSGNLFFIIFWILQIFHNTNVYILASENVTFKALTFYFDILLWPDFCIGKIIWLWCGESEVWQAVRRLLLFLRPELLQLILTWNNESDGQW